MPPTFTEETVAVFSHEAALCGALRHPNILKFYGLCVYPPNICLVTELCQGSLYELLHARANRPSDETYHHRQQLLIDLGYMLDAARAVAYLHSFSLPFVHRDIQPAKFLVSVDGTVKLTDFGASRTLAIRTDGGGDQRQPVSEGTGRTNATQPADLTTALIDVPDISSINTMATTPEYIAPEVIRAYHAGTVAYGEAAEVFALAITMWDVLHPGIPKYPDQPIHRLNRQHTPEQPPSAHSILDRVVSGERPLFEADVPESLHDLIEGMWQADPRLRPPMTNVVTTLEIILEEAGSFFAQELMADLAKSTPNTQTQTHVHGLLPTDAQTSFTGIQAVEKLHMRVYVETQSEAVRLGNLLMDAGFLHHVKHEQNFEYSCSQYYFDEDHIQLCQPLAMIEDDETAATVRLLQREKRPRAQPSAGPNTLEHPRARIDSISNASQVMLGQNTIGFTCPCRQLGQRLEPKQATRRRFRPHFKVFAENTSASRPLTDDRSVGFTALDDAGPRASRAA